MRPRPVVLLAALALAAGLGACGSDDEVSGAIPSTTPDLTIPTATSDAPEGTDTTSTTSTTSTSTTTTGAGAAAPPAAGSAPPAAAPPPAASQGGQTTGGAPSGQSTTGGAQARGGEFENFCSQNPGAC